MSDLTTEMGRLSAVECKTAFEPMKGSVSGVTNGLKALGILNDEQAKNVQVVEGALSAFTGMLSLVVAVKALQETKLAREEAKAAALTAAATAEAATIVGAPDALRRLALATAASTAVGVAMYTAVNNIKLGEFNLSTAEGQNQATNAVMEVI